MARNLHLLFRLSLPWVTFSLLIKCWQLSVAFASHPVLPVLSLIEAKAPRSCAVLALFICLLMKIVVNFVHISFYMVYINRSENSIMCKSCLVSYSTEKFPSCPQMNACRMSVIPVQFSWCSQRENPSTVPTNKSKPSHDTQLWTPMREQPQCQPFCEGEEQLLWWRNWIRNFCSAIFFPCGMQGFEHIFGEWVKLLTLIAIDCHEFLHMLIPIPLSARRAVWMHSFQCVLDR